MNYILNHPFLDKKFLNTFGKPGIFIVILAQLIPIVATYIWRDFLFEINLSLTFLIAFAVIMSFASAALIGIFMRMGYLIYLVLKGEKEISDKRMLLIIPLGVLIFFGCLYIQVSKLNMESEILDYISLIGLFGAPALSVFAAIQLWVDLK